MTLTSSTQKESGPMTHAVQDDRRTPRGRRPLSPRRLRALLVGLLAAVATLGVAGPATAASGARHYELATPVDKEGQTTVPNAISADGQVVTTLPGGNNAFPGVPSHYTFQNSYHLVRGASGWVGTSLNPVASDTGNYIWYAATRDLTTDLSLISTPEQESTGGSTFYRRQLGQPFIPSSPLLQSTSGGPDPFSVPEFYGASSDLSHVVMKSNPGRTLRPQDPVAPNGLIYEAYPTSTGAPGLRLVTVDDGGNLLPDATSCRPALGGFVGDVSTARNAISDDGRTIFFMTGGCYAGQQVFAKEYARIDGTRTVELTASECDRQADPGASPPVEACATDPADVTFNGASADGRRVLFLTTAQLTDSDVDQAQDLYEYDFDRPAGARLKQLSAGAADAATGAGVQGIVEQSDDAKQLYFSATGVLSDQANRQGLRPVPGATNLYHWNADTRRTTFVTTLDPADTLWGTGRQNAEATAGGTVLFFDSVGQLTADDTDAASDIFRYDAGTGALQRVSRAHSGFGNDGNDDARGVTMGPKEYGRDDPAAGARRQSSADGSQIIFATAQALQREDHNGAADIYEWHDGAVNMVSGGEDPRGVGVGNTYYLSADGSSAAFTTGSRLVDRDTDSAVDIYVARQGPDVPPLPPSPPAPCSGDACQGQPTAGPIFPGVGTIDLSGRDELPAPKDAATAKPRIAKLRPGRGTSVLLRVTVPARGRLVVSGTGLRTVRTSAGPGVKRIRVRLSAAAVRTQRSARTYATTVRVSFDPAVGRSTAATARLTLRATTGKGR